MANEELPIIARQVRQNIIRMLNAAGSGHAAGSLSAVEILVTLYFRILSHRPQEPNWPDRDRLIYSCGHTSPALYAVMAEAGYFSPDELITLRKFGSRLQGHPHNGTLPGIETSSGPLGEGLSQAIGIALAARLDKKNYRVYCVMSDGEQDEGQIWEAAMFAAKNKLTNLTAIIDRNGIQIDGKTENIMPLESLKAKYEAFGWKVLEIDGHDFTAIENTIKSSANQDKPCVIIAKTIPGKGVSFMEGKYEWHGKTPNAEETQLALKELNQ